MSDERAYRSQRTELSGANEEITPRNLGTRLRFVIFQVQLRGRGLGVKLRREAVSTQARGSYNWDRR